jgi:hypothetical protein
MGNGLHHPPTMNHTLSTPKQSKAKVFPKAKFQEQLCIPNYDSLQRKVVFFKVTNTPLYTNQKETSQETS